MREGKIKREEESMLLLRFQGSWLGEADKQTLYLDLPPQTPALLRSRAD